MSVPSDGPVLMPDAAPAALRGVAASTWARAAAWVAGLGLVGFILLSLAYHRVAEFGRHPRFVLLVVLCFCALAVVVLVPLIGLLVRWLAERRTGYTTFVHGDPRLPLLDRRTGALVHPGGARPAIPDGQRIGGPSALVLARASIAMICIGFISFGVMIILLIDGFGWPNPALGVGVVAMLLGRIGSVFVPVLARRELTAGYSSMRR
jgi:hypothetical protein